MAQSGYVGSVEWPSRTMLVQSSVAKSGNVDSVYGGPVGLCWFCLRWPRRGMLVQSRVAQLGYVGSV